MFKLDEKQKVLLQEWDDKISKKVLEEQKGKFSDFLIGDGIPYYGAIGGHLQYSFTPTSLGVIVIVKNCLTNDEINLTDYESW